MKWYLARLLFRSLINRQPGGLAEDTLRLVRAKNAAEARKKAVRFGKEAEHSYKNPYGELVRWRLVECIDVYEIPDPLEDGAEVYSLLLVPRELKQVQKMFTLKGGKRWVREV